MYGYKGNMKRDIRAVIFVCRKHKGPSSNKRAGGMSYQTCEIEDCKNKADYIGVIRGKVV